MHVLGLDVGATKSVCLLADADGRVIASSRGPGANLQASGSFALERALHELVSAVLAGPSRQVAAVCLGIAGADRGDDARLAADVVRQVCPGARVLVVNDPLIALVAAIGHAAGIVIIAGTGSIAYGRNEHGEAARAGGWGHVMGDEGSGYWLARRVLAAAVRAADGRGPRTRLLDLLLGQLQLESVDGLVRIVYDRDLPRHAIAQLASLVQRAWEDQDSVASSLIEDAAEELAIAARAVAGRLALTNTEIPFVLAGGAFQGVPRLTAALTPRLIEIVPRSRTVSLGVEPAMGAVRLALDDARGVANLPRYRAV